METALDAEYLATALDWDGGRNGPADWRVRIFYRDRLVDYRTFMALEDALQYQATVAQIRARGEIPQPELIRLLTVNK
jgi:hypothetical protein